MKCKEVEIAIKSGKPFSEDKLGRAPLAQNLTEICDALSESGAVIAIDGEWGTGKTTFVKMWRQMLEDDEYQTIYFNAWNSDFEDDPFIALMAELNSVFKASDGFRNVVASGAKIGLKVMGEIAKGVLKKTTGIDSEAISSGLDEAVSLCYDQMSDYQNKKNGLIEFRNKLSEFVASENKDKTVYFFIDELDRCNPHFAVKLLERVKYLFEVPNIIFVLAVNIEQLQYAIQGYYGSANIDGKQYLKRFIDIEYTLPAPDLEEYCRFLIKAYDFGSFFNHEQRRNDRDLYAEGELFESLATDIIVASNLNLRMTNKIFAYTRLALSGYSATQYTSSDLFFLLCYLKITNRSIYESIKEGKYTLQKLLNEIEEVLPPSLFKSDNRYLSDHHIAFALADLLQKYNYSGLRGIPRESEFKGKKIDDNNSQIIFPITPKQLSSEKLYEALAYEEQRGRHNMYGLKPMFNKIDLIDTLRFS